MTTKVRRTLMHLVLGSAEIPNVSATEAAAAHVPTTEATASHVAATTHVASSGMTTSTTSSVAVAVRHTLKTEQRGTNDQTSSESH